jgi:hypothetical protein
MPQARRSVSDGRSPKRLDQPGRSGRVLRSQAGVWGNIMNALASAYDALVRRKIRAADEALGWAAYPDVADPPSLDPLGHTAVFVVGSSRSGGVPALEWVRREFPGEFRNCIFMDVRTHGGTNQRRNVKIFLANSEPSTHGTSRHFAAPQQFGRFREGFRMPARHERSIRERRPASESLRRTNPRESGEELAVYGDLTEERGRRGRAFPGSLRLEGRR